MDILRNKRYEQFDYNCRYINVPYYYNSKDERDIYGLGSNMKKDNIAWVAHKVKETDTLDYLALKYYNNPSFWWVIAYFNDIQDPFIPIIWRYKLIKIPNISSVEFGDER